MKRASALIACLVFLGLSACGDEPYCDVTSESVKHAKNLTDSQLADLFSKMRELSQDGPKMFGYGSKVPEIPPQFAIAKPTGLLVRSKEQAFLYLEVCSLDTKVALIFHMPEEGRGKITLQWGDDPASHGSEQLWPKT